MNKSTLYLIEIVIILILVVVIIKTLQDRAIVDDEQFVFKADNLLIGFEYEKSAKVHNFFTNSEGYRDTEREFEKTTTNRIAVLGDSITAGYGSDKTYTGLMEAYYLDSNLDIDVLNFGVEGYNTVQEIELLETYVLQYSPDLVILQVTLNDLEEFHFDSVLSKYDLWKRQKLMKKKFGFTCPDEPENKIHDLHEKNHDFFEGKYYDSCYTDIFNMTLKNFKVLSEEHNFKPVLLLTPYNLAETETYFEKMIGMLESQNIELIIIDDELNNSNSYFDAIHPNGDGHEIIANILTQRINFK